MEAGANTKSDTEAAERERVWDKAEVTEIARVAADDREKAESEAVDRVNALAEAKAKQRADIARITAEDSKKLGAQAEVRVTNKLYAAQRADEEAAADIRSIEEARRTTRERWKGLRQGPRLMLRSSKRWRI